MLTQPSWALLDGFYISRLRPSPNRGHTGEGEKSKSGTFCLLDGFSMLLVRLIRRRICRLTRAAGPRARNQPHQRDTVPSFHDSDNDINTVNSVVLEGRARSLQEPQGHWC